MENLVNRPAFWPEKSVLLTGHTGFKGSWLALSLQQQGARVSGLALPPTTAPSLFEVARVAEGMESHLCDLRDLDAVRRVVSATQPEIVFHLAAQALVSEGYRDPVGTYATNVLGTVHLLEALRQCPSVRVIVVVTSDKCYANHENGQAYVEDDPLGGHDPYSASKACTDLVAQSWHKAFFGGQGPALATARAGNVFGGGDWSPGRLIPDLLAAFSAGQTARLRRPLSVRPWQHVLCPLMGYLILAEKLWQIPDLANAYNFGPELADCLPAAELANRLAARWGEGARWQSESTDFPHEAGLLRLDATRARQRLGWSPRWNLALGLDQTIAWQRAYLARTDMRAFTLQQIAEHDATSPLPRP